MLAYYGERKNGDRPTLGYTATAWLAKDATERATRIESPGRLWLNEQAIGPAGHGPILVELREGWNTLAVRGGPSERFVRWRDLNKPADEARPD